MIHPHSRRSSQRVTITIPYVVHGRICALADKQGRSASNLSAYLIERALETFFPESGTPSRFG